MSSPYIPSILLVLGKKGKKGIDFDLSEVTLNNDIVFPNPAKATSCQQHVMLYKLLQSEHVIRFAEPETSLGLIPIFSAPSFPSEPPSLPLWFQWSLLLPDHRHPGVSAGVAMLTYPSHRHTCVHPSLS